MTAPTPATTPGQAPGKIPAKRRRPAWLEHLLLWLLLLPIGFIRLWPLNLARAMARGLGHVIYFFLGPNFLQVDYHLRLAFREELTLAARHERARVFWLHFCQGVVEALLMYRWNAQTCREQLDFTEYHEFKAYMAKTHPPGKGVIMVSGHLGSWELGAYGIALIGEPMHLIANPGSVPPITAYMKQQRERSGMVTHSRDDHPWSFKKVLDKGGWLCIAMDLNAGRHGEYVPFFGVQTSTYMSAAALQQATGCPIMVGSSARMPDGKHKAKVWKVIERPKGGGAEERLQVTREINEALEQAIRTYPEQWLWNYRRWRRRPEGEMPGPDGLPPKV